MKNNFLLIILIFVCSLSSAQYIKLPLDTNHYWHDSFYLSQGMTSYFCDYQYNAIKDTLISTITYKKVLRTNIICNSPNGGTYSPTKAFLRQDTILKRVIILDNNYQEKLLYNFNKSVGDTALLYNVVTSSYSTYTLNLKDSVLLNDGFYHKRFYWGDSYFAIIEGVGGRYGLFTAYWIGFGVGTDLICLGKTYPTLSTIYHKGGNTYSCSPFLGSAENSAILNDTDINVFPNPSSDQINVLSKNNSVNIKSIIIKDVLGKEIKVFTNVNSTEYALDLKSLISGIYIMTIQLPDKSVYRRLIKN